MKATTQLNHFLNIPIIFFNLFIISCTKSTDVDSKIDVLPETKILIENFEGTSYKNWKIEGDAFSYNLVSTSVLSEWGDKGFEGAHMMTSFVNGDVGIGTMTSPSFTIKKDYINFLIGGGGDFNNVYVALYVDGKEVYRESGSNSRIMNQASWCVSDYKGKIAYIKLVDNSKRAWGFIDVDYFYQSDKQASNKKSCRIKIEKKYLNFPIDADGEIENVLIKVNNAIEYDIDLKLAENVPDYWVYLDCSQWIGKEIEIYVPLNQYLNESGNSINGQGLDLVYQSDEPKEMSSFYQEALRPKFHFTSIRGWLNDPCGLVWSDGYWHLCYQHNPFGTDWGNMHWGHAASSDLVHWKEYNDVLRPDSLGAIFSGYSIVDKENSLGLQQGGNKTIVAYYTAAGEYNYISRERPFTQCMAYSVDNGYSWIKYKRNPVLSEIAFQNRDPHVVWCPEDNRWVMVLFLTGNQYGFFASSDLVNWSQTSVFNIPEEWECPDFFRIKVEDSQNEYKWVLMGVQNKYFVGDFKGGTFIPVTTLNKQDLGDNYLAAHTFSNAPDGRHVQIGCMGNSKFPMLPFDEMMSFPKELKLYKTDSGYKLYALPVKEIESLHDKLTSYENLTLLDKDVAISNTGTAFHIKGEFDLTNSSAQYFGFEVNGVKLLFYPASNYFVAKGGSLLRNYSTNNVTPVNGIVSMEILLDTGIIECFINNGEYSLTLFYLTSNVDKTVSFCKDEGSVKVKTMQIAELKSMWK